MSSDRNFGSAGKPTGKAAPLASRGRIVKQSWIGLAGPRNSSSLEDGMTSSHITAWESEFKALLETIRSHPSRDLSEERARAAVLEKLIADHYRNNPE